MNVEELKNELDVLGVPPGWYSINGHLKSDTCILNHVHSYWEYFYFDEKGNQEGYKRFDNEGDACIYLLDILKKEIGYFGKF